MLWTWRDNHRWSGEHGHLKEGDFKGENVLTTFIHRCNVVEKIGDDVSFVIKIRIEAGQFRVTKLLD